MVISCNYKKVSIQCVIANHIFPLRFSNLLLKNRPKHKTGVYPYEELRQA